LLFKNSFVVTGYPVLLYNSNLGGYDGRNMNTRRKQLKKTVEN